MNSAEESGATGDHQWPRVSTLRAEEPVAARWLILSALGLFFMYALYPAYPTEAGKSLAGWTWFACNPKNGFLHGRFIPVAFAVMAWLFWQRVRGQRVNPSWIGLIPLVLGLLLYVASIRTIQPRLALIGLPFVLVGITYFSFGWQIAKVMLFPAFFFWFAIPVPGLETLLTGRLQILITKLCYHVGVLVGMDLTMAGTTISVRGEELEIAPGCSGIRSLMALVMIAAVYANYTQSVLWKKGVLFLSSFPLAIVGNFGRIFTILVLSQFGLEDFAKKTYHDWAGLLIFFPIALSGLYLVDYLLNFKERRKKKVRRTVKSKVVSGSQEKA